MKARDILAGLLASMDYHRDTLVWMFTIALLVGAILVMVETFHTT